MNTKTIFEYSIPAGTPHLEFFLFTYGKYAWIQSKFTHLLISGIVSIKCIRLKFDISTNKNILKFAHTNNDIIYCKQFKQLTG